MCGFFRNFAVANAYKFNKERDYGLQKNNGGGVNADIEAFILWLLLLFKFFLFDFIWCLPSTFISFSTFEFYLSKIIVTLIFLAPYKFFRLWKTEVTIMFLLDILLVVNLMYFRTYYATIPLHSYSIAGNLIDFTDSIYDSFRWYDLLFPLSTIAGIFICRNYKVEVRHISYVCYISVLVISVFLFSVIIYSKGGFIEAYNYIRSRAQLCTFTTTRYTVFGDLYYDLVQGNQKITPEIKQEIGDWLKQKPEHLPLAGNIEIRNNCIIILAESLESWLLEREVEGKEVTPYLNKLIHEPTTLYAPYVLTQVKGGRSIDAQLLLCAGMLPINSGTYSAQYPFHTYHTLQKAMHQLKGARNYLLTVDKLSTWNQGAVARSFGIDTLVSHFDFRLTETAGPRKRLGDRAFLAQCKEKIENGEIWNNGENVYMQLVTYSGHSPFVLSDTLKDIYFSQEIPQIMNDYMTVAHYTDKAIGQFVEYLKTLPQYRETLIVITGDHEGLALRRKELCETPGARGIVSDKTYTPCIIVNSPVAMRYDKVMGQIDMYPTLLNLMQLDDYNWKGMGQSILDSRKKGYAISPQMELDGEGATQEEIIHSRRAYKISDLMIRFNYFDSDMYYDGCQTDF